MARFETLDEVSAAVGRDLGTTSWHQVLEADIRMFAQAVDTWDWFHVEIDRAVRESPFRTAVVQPYLLLSLSTRFIGELIEVPGTWIVPYGVNRVRYPSALPVKGRVRARGEVKDARRHGEGVLIEVELTYEAEDAERPPCVAEVVAVLAPEGVLPRAGAAE